MAEHPATVRSVARGELPLLRLEGRQAVLEIARQGAHVIDWRVPGIEPLLFLSPKTAFAAGKAIRGGVPLVFPWFGPKRGDPRAAQHGFARVRDWSMEAAAVAADDSCGVTMALADDERTRAAWPHPFKATFSVRASRELRMALEVRNTGSAPFVFEAAMHTYLAVSDVRQVSVLGLENTGYVDKVDGGAPKREGTAPLVLTGETDRVYLDTAAACTVVDPGLERRIVVAKQGSRATVLWNPWADKAAAMADLGADCWHRFLCIETANADRDAVTLAPGASHVLEAIIAPERL